MGYSFRVVIFLITAVVALSSCQRKSAGREGVLEGAWQDESNADSMLLISGDQMQITSAMAGKGSYLSGKKAKSGESVRLKIKKTRTKVTTDLANAEFKIISLSKERLVLSWSSEPEKKVGFRRISLQQYQNEGHILKVGSTFDFVYATVDRKIKIDEKSVSSMDEAARSDLSSSFTCTYSKSTHAFQLELSTLSRGQDGKTSIIADPMITLAREWPFELSVAEEAMESKRLLGEIRFARAGIQRTLMPTKALLNCQESYQRKADQVHFEISCQDAEVEALLDSKTAVEKADLKFVGTCSPLVTN